MPSPLPWGVVIVPDPFSFPSPFLFSFPDPKGARQKAEKIVPRRCPCGVASGRGRSRRCGGGSCAGGRATRTCRSGSGRTCCRRGRTAYPVMADTVRILVLSSNQFPSRPPDDPIDESPTPVLVGGHSTRRVACRVIGRGLGGGEFVVGSVSQKGSVAYLAGVDPLAGEGIVVGPHFGGGCRLSLSGLVSAEVRGWFLARFWPNSLVQLWDRAAM
ncbi:hypothetical protein VTJ49DRAFT_7679 [Mycothermus thermophilus]|uniref:Uncharacterized protein n=1 Tax=Humicola insolens TaxID=85995 RepID=A0ABR3VHD3_HUMIN